MLYHCIESFMETVFFLDKQLAGGQAAGQQLVKTVKRRPEGGG